MLRKEVLSERHTIQPQSKLGLAFPFWSACPIDLPPKNRSSCSVRLRPRKGHGVVMSSLIGGVVSHRVISSSGNVLSLWGISS